MNTSNNILSIITPTYNRKHLLLQCYESLLKQTDYRFEWIVVDDGSTDSTVEELFPIFKSNDLFSVTCISKENGGKHTALNAAHEFINGKYVLILDSDDYLVPSAVADVLNAWEVYGKSDAVGQVIFLKGYSESEPVCYVKNECLPLDTLKERRISTKGRQRDCCDTYRTDLFIKYPFPVFKGEHFIGEGSAFFFIEEQTKGIYINKVICVVEYLSDGLSSAGRKMRLLNPKGGRYDSHVYMSNRLPMTVRIKKGMLYTCYSKFDHVPIKQIFAESNYTILTLLTYWPGVILFKYWQKKYFKEE